MKLLKQLAGKKTFDHQREADEFKAHFDRIFEKVVAHLQESQDGAAWESLTGALMHISDRVEAFNKLVEAVRAMNATGA